ncbi:hypothetical protein RND81_05G106100 [Saponaria officinalis]|uniref:Helicase ATP-binding domain-containing protein n=1 Tax=Saponaria officinalis TaxID=3572 RepID=A0AAW1KVP4_SAPOF
MITYIWFFIQAACIPSILLGKDTVVAAETGSGKTHGYLVPLLEKLLCAVETSNDEAPNRGKRFSSQLSLILCPNVMLCEQVVRMASCLCDDNGEPLFVAAALCGKQGWPHKRPDIIVHASRTLKLSLCCRPGEKPSTELCARCQTRGV